ncbi:restriction endonuclease [Tenacibaculum xiamenense]|uniref:restriction endonuclease n=1 Tax=Tenacibaculum xiamenense TaxID=1261553 RepID=UPI0038B66A29
MGFEKILHYDTIKLNNISNQIEVGNCEIVVPYEKISPSNWGKVYEKYVGQILEKEGFQVKYNGLNLGKLDGGIDLIAENDNLINLIQCKYLKGKIAKSKIDWILYRASNKLFKTYKISEKKLVFTLIVNNIDINFSKRIPKNFKLKFTDIEKVKYPWLQYYLDHNHIQDKIKLEFREVRMN